MTTPTEHPEFTKALAAGHVEAVMLPDGTPLLIDNIPIYQAAQGGAMMYQGRFLQFTDVMDKHDRLKLDDTLIRGLLVTGEQAVGAAMARIHSDPEGAMGYLAQHLVLLRNAQERLDLYADLNALGVGTLAGKVYELASVWFFTPVDDPAVWNSANARTFILKLLMRPELFSFFLRLPMGNYVPLVKPSDDDLTSCMTALLEVNRLDWLTYQTVLSTYKRDGVKNDTITSISSLVAMLDGYDNSYEHHLRSFTSTPPPANGTMNEIPQNHSN